MPRSALNKPPTDAAEVVAICWLAHGGLLVAIGLLGFASAWLTARVDWEEVRSVLGDGGLIDVERAVVEFAADLAWPNLLAGAVVAAVARAYAWRLPGARLVLASVAIAHLAAAPWVSWRLQRGVPADSPAEGVLWAVEAITFIMVVVAVVLTLRVLARPASRQAKARKMR